MSTTQFPDAVVGSVVFPKWLIEIQEEQAVRRMFFIRQLGLKAYIDFPGAIHTRYSHSLGVMHLAGRVVDILRSRLEEKGKKKLADNLLSNKDTLMAAGFLHDIAHGPFSHAVDFPMTEIIAKSHEDMAREMISGRITESLEHWAIGSENVVQIISGKHEFPFLREIINGPMDVDKLDYLLRDAYHIGLKYSFDLDHFINQLTVIGDESNLSGCGMGLANTDNAIVISEIFLLIWKSMYDLVYHIRDSRIAEKMLEKAILANKNKVKIRRAFSTVEGFKSLDDERLLELLERIPETLETVQAIRKRKLYREIQNLPLNERKFDLDATFISALKGGEEERNKLSEKLTLDLCRRMGLEPYKLICDIVRSRSPKDVHIDHYDSRSKEWTNLRGRSKIVADLRGE